jgi:hypothetical protein
MMFKVSCSSKRFQFHRFDHIFVFEVIAELFKKVLNAQLLVLLVRGRQHCISILKIKLFKSRVIVFGVFMRT